MRVTIDTNIFPIDDILELAASRSIELVRISVTDREVVNAPVRLDGTTRVAENAVWGESAWGGALFASSDGSLEEILRIISNNSFPAKRENLSDGQRRQLRDAMIFDAHLRTGNALFASCDKRAFLKSPVRDSLELKFNTKIVSRVQLLEILNRLAT